MLLKNLLENPIFSKSHVLAGHNGLKRTAQSVNIMDAPDIINYLKPGELLLTNGYFIKEKPEELIQLIDSMDQLGCSGLAIKTKRFSLEIPPEALSRADSIAFPIIELSEVNHSLGEIFQQSTSFILDNTNHELQYSLSIHKQFSSMIMQGQGIQGLLEALQQLLASPVLMLSHKLQSLAQSSHFLQPAMQSLVPAIIAALDSSSRVQADVPFRLSMDGMGDYSYIEVFPIVTYRLEGYLICFNLNQPQWRLLALAIEQAASVISMELTKNQAVKERSRRYKNEFFSDLIDGFMSEQEIIHRGKKYGLRQGSMILIAAKEDEVLPSAQKLRTALSDEQSISKRDMQYELIKKRFSTLGFTFVMFTRSDTFGVLMFMEEGEWDETAFAKGLHIVTEDLYEQSGLSLSLGIGHPVTNVLDIGLSYKEAVKALQAGYQMSKSRFVQSYQSNDISYLLRMLPHEELRHFYEETFKGFAAVNETERKELLRTLRMFYNNQCQLLETSKQLFVHRNTVIYRLDKCEKLTGLDMKDALESLRFRLAFAIEPLLKPKELSG